MKKSTIPLNKSFSFKIELSFLNQEEKFKPGTIKKKFIAL